EPESGEALDPHRLQPEAAAIEIRQLLAARGGTQRAVQRVAPGVVAAAQHRGDPAAPFQQQPVAPMLADIVKGPYLAVGPAQEHDALVEDFLGQIGPRLRQLALMADDMPGLVEDPLTLRGEDLRVVEEARRQRIGMLRLTGIPIEFLVHHWERLALPAGA